MRWWRTKNKIPFCLFEHIKFHFDQLLIIKLLAFQMLTNIYSPDNLYSQIVCIVPTFDLYIVEFDTFYELSRHKFKLLEKQIIPWLYTHFFFVLINCQACNGLVNKGVPKTMISAINEHTDFSREFTCVITRRLSVQITQNQA